MECGITPSTMSPLYPCNRRKFIQHSVAGGLAALAAAHLPGWKGLQAAPIDPTARVALTYGDERADNVFRGLQMFRKEIAAAIGNKRVLIKPNLVMDTDQPSWHPNGAYVSRSNTQADVLLGILEFLKSIGIDNALIAEANAYGKTFQPMETLGYFKLAKKYKVQFGDLNQEAFTEMDIYNGAGTNKVRISRLMMDRNYFIISAARIKTHDTVVATFSYKNIGMGSPIQDVSQKRKDKGRMHGNADKNVVGSTQDLNDNLHLLAKRGVRPDLAVVDGFEGIENDGPIFGLPVDHRVCVVSPDWLAADRVCCELIGLGQRGEDYLPGYLRYCGLEGNLGTFDLSKIEVIGEPLARHIRTYQLHQTAENWQMHVSPVPRTQRTGSAYPGAQQHRVRKTYELGPAQ